MEMYIVDFQGFRRSTNLFVLKEVAVVPLEDWNIPWSAVYKPPCKFSRLLSEERRINQWLENHFHGISWTSGDIPYNYLIRDLQRQLKDACIIFVKGLEKKKWLEEHVPEVMVIDLDVLDCPTLKNLPSVETDCTHHQLKKRGQIVCAKENVIKLRKWLNEELDRVSTPKQRERRELLKNLVKSFNEAIFNGVDEVD